MSPCEYDVKVLKLTMHILGRLDSLGLSFSGFVSSANDFRLRDEVVRNWDIRENVRDGVPRMDERVFVVGEELGERVLDGEVERYHGKGEGVI